MPVIGIPLPSSSPDPGFSLLKKSAVTPELFGEKVLTRRPGIVSTAGSEGNFQIALLDPDDNVLYIDENVSLVCRFVEAIQHDAILGESTGTLEELNTALISFTIPPAIRTYAGVYLASVGVFYADNLAFVRRLWLYNEPSPWASNASCIPPIDEVRLWLRDSSPVENELLNYYQFGTEEIAQAVVDTIKLYNNTPPPVDFRTTQNFLHEPILRNGVQYFLFEIFLEWLRKNKLAYTAGGVNIDDMSVKIQDYMVASQQRYQDLRLMIQRKKAQYNLYHGFGKLG